MKIRGHLNIAAMFADRDADRVLELADKWQDEAAEHALAGRPVRAHYVETWARRVEAQAQQIRMGGRPV